MFFPPKVEQLSGPLVLCSPCPWQQNSAEKRAVCFQSSRACITGFASTTLSQLYLIRSPVASRLLNSSPSSVLSTLYPKLFVLRMSEPLDTLQWWHKGQPGRPEPAFSLHLCLLFLEHKSHCKVGCKLHDIHPCICQLAHLRRAMFSMTQCLHYAPVEDCSITVQCYNVL